MAKSSLGLSVKFGNGCGGSGGGGGGGVGGWIQGWSGSVWEAVFHGSRVHSTGYCGNKSLNNIHIYDVIR